MSLKRRYETIRGLYIQLLDHNLSTSIVNTIPSFSVDLLLPLGSCGKAMICFVSAKLVQEGIISWDKPIQSVIPEFIACRDYTTSHLTLRDLLNHKWSVKLYPSNRLLYPEGDYSSDDIIHSAKYLEETSDLRTGFYYSNYGYALAGIVIERWTNRTLSDLLHEFVFEPCEMTQTTTNCVQLKDKWCRTVSHQSTEGQQGTLLPFVQPKFLGSSGIYSTVDDIAKWIRFRFFENNCNTRIAEELNRIQTITLNDSKSNSWITGYSFGWAVKNMGPYQVFTHPGETYSISLKLMVIPELKKAAIVFLNEYNRPLLDSISHDLLDILRTDIIPSVPYEPLIRPAFSLTGELYLNKDCCGTYKNDVLGTLRIECTNNDSLQLCLDKSLYTISNLKKTKDNQIYAEMISPFTFERYWLLSFSLSSVSCSVPSQLGTKVTFTRI